MQNHAHGKRVNWNFLDENQYYVKNYDTNDAQLELLLRSKNWYGFLICTCNHLDWQ